MAHTTYEMRVVRQIVMVQGWRVVYWVESKHAIYEIEALGLGYRNTHDGKTHKLLPPLMGGTQEEDWEIYPLEYHYAEGWVISETASNYCGLIAPGDTLERFESYNSCQNKHEHE